MSDKNIFFSNFVMKDEFNFKGNRIEIKGKSKPCITVSASDINETIDISHLVPIIEGAIPVCSGRKALSPTIVAVLGSMRVAEKILVSQDPNGFKFSYHLPLLKVVNGASIKENLLTEDKLKKIITLSVSQLLKNAGPGFSSWRDVLIDAMQNATLQEFMKGVQSAVCAMTGDPVNADTGNFIYEKEDLRINGRVPLYVRRSYNRMDIRSGSLGKGWRHNYEIQLLIDPDRYVILWGDGREEIYMKDEDLSPIPLFGGMERLKMDQEGFLHEGPDGQVNRFDPQGKLLWRRDGRGRGIMCSYDQKGRLVQVTDRKGAALTYHYDRFSGLLCEVVDHKGRSVRFLYELDRLKEVQDPEGKSYRYFYDAGKNMSRIQNPRGICVLENVYDGKGRTIQQKFADGGVITYDHQEELGRTLVTEQNGNKVAHVYDERYRNVGDLYVDGEVHFSYNDRNQLIVKTDKRGNRTKLAYDGKGNLSQIIYPDGEKLDMTYDGDGHLLAFSVNGILKIENTYDGHGNLLRTVDALGRTREMSYDEEGNMVELLLPDSSRIFLTYDDRGNITQIREGSGCQISYGYDAYDRVVSTVDGEGDRTEFAYDACDRLIRVTDPEGNHCSYGYTSNGKLARFTDFNGAVSEWRYNCMNKVEEVLLPDGECIRLGYDQMQNVTKKTYPNGAEEIYRYDGLNRLEQITLPNGGTIQYGYDQDGNITWQIDPEGDRIGFAYDERGRLTRTVSPTGAVTEYGYDGEGRLSCIKNAAGRCHTYVYDQMGQLIREISTTGDVTSYGYNDMGKVSVVVDARKRRTEYEYHPGGRLAKAIYPDGGYEMFTYDKNGRLVHRQDHKGIYVGYAYDRLGRLVSICNSDGQQWVYTYDAVGNVTSIKDPLGHKIQYGYSLGGKLLSVIDAGGDRTEYAYDPMGKLSVVCRHEGSGCLLDMDGTLHLDGLDKKENLRVTRYQRDLMGHITCIKDPLGASEYYRYDRAGRLVAKKDRDGYETRYGYNGEGDLAYVHYDDGRQVEFSYDALRKLREVEDWLGVIWIERDGSGRVRKIRDQEGRETCYEWGPFGERKALLYPDGRRIDYGYDGSGRLERVADGVREVLYRYDGEGRLSEKQYPGGISCHYGYDRMGRLSTLVHQRRGEIYERYGYGYDQIGNKISIQKSGDGSLYQYRYDPLNRLTEVQKDHHALRRYQYDAFGNRILLEAGEDRIHYTYNAADQLIQIERKGLTEIREYDRRGNLTAVKRGQDLVNGYRYGADNRLEKAINADGQAASYVYDGLGNRVGMEMYDLSGEPGLKQGSFFGTGYLKSHLEPPTKTVRYLLDLTKQYRSLLVKTETVGDRAVSQSYVWDTDVLFALDGERAGVCLQDGLGSTVRYLDLQTEGQTIYEYDEFGQDLYGTQGEGQPFGYTGYQKDMVAGSYFAQAREYLPEIGRFSSEDWIKGYFRRPETLNRYQYCKNDPLGHIDENGMAPHRVADPSQTLDTSTYLYYDEDITDREKAIEALNQYAKKYAQEDPDKFISNPDYPYFSNGSGNCANFVSQCLYAAGMDMTDEWYMGSKVPIPVRLFQKVYEKVAHKDLDPVGAIANTGQEYSLTWTSAGKQFAYFSDPKNGYMEGGVIKVGSLEEYYRVAGLGVIEAGDLLYWDEDGDGVINHATIINGFDERGLLFTGNTKARFDHPVDDIYKDYLEANSNSSVFYFVRMKDSVFTSCHSSD